MNGILLVDKPAGLTSHDVVDRIRRAAGMRRVGHTGTLDPAATGLLILCLGPATRLSEFLTGLDKVYEGTMRLGLTTDSYDLDGKVVAEKPVPPVTAERIQSIFDTMTGTIMQVPPMVSAVKVGGERLYKMARKGVVVEREPRPVTIREFTLLELAPPDVQFRVRCTRGTYARSLCHDVGELLGCGAALAALRRTFVGPHSVDTAKPVEYFQNPESVRSCLLNVDSALELPQVTVRRSSRPMVSSGGLLGIDDLTAPCPVQDGWIQVKSEAGELLALGEVHLSCGQVRIQPKRVLCEK
ncbi:MAG: tRNA pseudouridine(55) synthase TruB [Candidatus Hydrogenedentes bacterium]|nr:tRNA pseudouridine(55) synthase TruB [Candidatus Hydrogenedentota bacterium]